MKTENCICIAWKNIEFFLYSASTTSLMMHTYTHTHTQHMLLVIKHFSAHNSKILFLFMPLLLFLIISKIDYLSINYLAKELKKLTIRLLYLCDLYKNICDQPRHPFKRQLTWILYNGMFTNLYRLITFISQVHGYAYFLLRILRHCELEILL